MKPKVGIRPTIDGRWGGAREGLEEKTMTMAYGQNKYCVCDFTMNNRLRQIMLRAGTTVRYTNNRKIPGL